MTAEKGQREWALAAAGGVAVLTALLHVKWVRNEHFFHLITKTLRGRDYYAAAEVRGALDQIRPGKDFFAVHPHGCLSAGWTWNVSFLDLATSSKLCEKDICRRVTHMHRLLARAHTNVQFYSCTEANRLLSCLVHFERSHIRFVAVILER
jgi:hypothetical protein